MYMFRILRTQCHCNDTRFHSQKPQMSQHNCIKLHNYGEAFAAPYNSLHSIMCAMSDTPTLCHCATYACMHIHTYLSEEMFGVSWLRLLADYGEKGFGAHVFSSHRILVTSNSVPT